MRRARARPEAMIAVLALALSAGCGGSEGGGPSSLGDGSRPAASKAEATCRDAFIAICGYYARCEEQAIAMCETASDLGRELCEIYVTQYLEEFCNDTREICDGAEIKGMDQARLRGLITCVNQLSCDRDPASACGDEAELFDLER